MRRSLRLGAGWISKHAPNVAHLAVGAPTVVEGSERATRHLTAQVHTPGGAHVVVREADIEYTLAPAGESDAAAKRRSDHARAREERIILRFNEAMAKERREREAASERAERELLFAAQAKQWDRRHEAKQLLSSLLLDTGLDELNTAWFVPRPCWMYTLATTRISNLPRGWERDDESLDEWVEAFAGRLENAVEFVQLHPGREPKRATGDLDLLGDAKGKYLPLATQRCSSTTRI